MLRTRDPDATGLCRRGIRVLPMALAVLLCSGALAAQEALGPGQPWTGDEPLPPAVAAARSEAPLALWDLRVVGSALKPRTSNVDYNVAGGGGCTYVTAGSASTVWNAPLFLPEGSTVLGLRVYYNDTSASDLVAWFTVYDLYGSIVNEWSASSTGSSGQGFQDSVAINHVVNYNAYSYVVNYRPVASGSTLQFCGVRIFFEAPAEIFIDGFETGDTSRWSSVTP